MFITDKSLVNGTATKAQRRLVFCIKLAAIFFWLAWVCGGVSLLPSNPAAGLALITLMSIGFFLSVRSVRKGRADALRKLQERHESRQARQHRP